MKKLNRAACVVFMQHAAGGKQAILFDVASGAYCVLF